jgi:hypothetical protein
LYNSHHLIHHQIKHWIHHQISVANADYVDAIQTFELPNPEDIGRNMAFLVSIIVIQYWKFSFQSIQHAWKGVLSVSIGTDGSGCVPYMSTMISILHPSELTLQFFRSGWLLYHHPHNTLTEKRIFIPSADLKTPVYKQTVNLVRFNIKSWSETFIQMFQYDLPSQSSDHPCQPCWDCCCCSNATQHKPSSQSITDGQYDVVKISWPTTS